MHAEMLSPAYFSFWLKKDLLIKSFHLAHRLFPEGGTCLEFGVFRGDSYVFQAHQILHRYTHTRLIGFDSWQGLPEETRGVWLPVNHSQGAYSATKAIVGARLRRLGVSEDDPRFRLVDGFFETSLTPDLQDEISDVIFVNIDVDIHRSTMELLEFIRPRLRPGVILYWDDWKNPFDSHPSSEWGEHLAWREWSQKNWEIQAETLAQNWVLQRTMIVTRVGDTALPEKELARARGLIGDLTSARGRAENLLLNNSLARGVGRWIDKRIRTGATR